jgi:hypothetical protein
MNSNPTRELNRPSLSDLERRMTELTGVPHHFKPRPQLHNRPEPPKSPPVLPPTPVLGDAALYGVAGLVVCGLAPHSEAHPAAILLQ